MSQLRQEKYGRWSEIRFTGIPDEEFMVDEDNLQTNYQLECHDDYKIASVMLFSDINHMKSWYLKNH